MGAPRSRTGQAFESAEPFDPLDSDMAAAWDSPKPELLLAVSTDPWRTNGDTVERIELLAAQFVSGEIPCPENWPSARAVLAEIKTRIAPSVMACGPAEISAVK